ncbi:hypothetical protein FORC066_3271 [Yersinia enterocolitica]|nr:hypothetical protein FORC065_1208 [Yersinia enterocolitica]UXD30478.1 hypothetical protein FORC066_3271 [Yersinia enterocolitica]
MAASTASPSANSWIGKDAFVDVPHFTDAVAVTYITEIKKL